MIQVDEKELSIIVELANRALKSAGEAYAMQTIIEKWNAQQDANEKRKKKQGELNAEA